MEKTSCWRCSKTHVTIDDLQVTSLWEPINAPETTSDNLVQIQAVSKDPRDGQVYVSYRPLGTEDSWVRPVGSFRRAYRAWRSK
jgi:hypothetical protein